LRKLSSAGSAPPWAQSRRPEPEPSHATLTQTGRPEVANLVLLTALCERASPEQVALEIGSRGAAELKRRAIHAANERLRPIREHRAELMGDRAYLQRVLLDGSATARAIAQDTLRQVSAAIHTQY
jgi:tryptophanyl-tRNA synthetase